jgi:hypothetical protein
MMGSTFSSMGQLQIDAQHRQLPPERHEHTGAKHSQLQQPHFILSASEILVSFSEAGSGLQQHEQWQQQHS